MKKKRFTEEQIIGALKEHEAGVKTDDLCRRLGISTGTFYNWRSKYGGLEVNEAKRLRELEHENTKLKKLLAEKLLEVEAMKDVLSKKVVAPADRKPVVTYLKGLHSLSERQACKLVGISRTGYRHQGNPPDDNILRLRLGELAKQYPRYGYLMLHSLLKSEGLVINRKRTYRLYKEAGLQVRTKKRKKLTRPAAVMTPPVAPNSRWSMDFVADQLSNGRRFRILNVVDEYSRELIGQLIRFSITGQEVARFLSQLAEKRSLPGEIVCDNGTEFTSKAMFFWSQESGTTLRFIQPGKPTQNAFVESLNGKFRNECLNQHWFQGLDHAKTVIRKWQHHYNHVRPHSSLGYLSPVAFLNLAA